MAAPAPVRSEGASFEAHQLYLRGRHAWNRRTEEGLRQSLVFFQRAIEKDNGYASAWAGLADAYTLLGDFGLESPAVVMPPARHAAQKALDIDATLGEAWSSLGLIAAVHDWEWETAEQFFLKAIEYKPGYSTAHHWYGCDLLALHSRWREAWAEMGIARQLDPLEPSVWESYNYTYLLARQFAEAEARYRELLEQAPDFYKSYTGLGRVLAACGRFSEALAMLERGRSLAGDNPSLLAALAQVHGMSGDRAQARRLLESLRALAARRHVSNLTLAIAWLGAGETNAALDSLELAAAGNELQLGNIAVHPCYDELRGQARFDALVARMGLPQEPGVNEK